MSATIVAMFMFIWNVMLKQFLLEVGADVNSHDIYIQTPLHRAAQGESVETITVRIFDEMSMSMGAFSCTTG